MPSVEFPPAIPFTSQAMVAPAAKQNDAANTCGWPRLTLVKTGEIGIVAAHIMVALALPTFELSAALVAVTVIVGGEGGAVGAVYSAVVALVVAIVPNVELPPAMPFTLHATPAAEPLVAEMLAVNTCSPLVGTLAVAGATVTTMLSFKFTIAEPFASASAWLIAVTVTLGGDGKIAGAA